MTFDILFYSSLSICIIGTCYKVFAWTKKSIGYEKAPPSSHGLSDHRFSGMARGIISSIFSSSILSLVQSFFIDVLFQGRSLKTSFFRWVMHFLIFTGFLALLFMHAFDEIFTENLFSYYYSTVNPFFFLRNLFGLMVLSGVGLAIYRRYVQRPARLKNTRSDLYALVILLIIILSGFLLEGMKMASVSEFTAMVEEYAGLDYEDEDIIALEAFWVRDFALVSARAKGPFEDELIELGIETHEGSCMDCHSPNKSAFLGYATAKLISPVAVILDSVNGVSIFYYIHILACFTGLALLPFSKMFHIVATPISLMTNAVEKQKRFKDENLLTKQLMELSACTHCSTCNLNCSAGMMYESIQNDYILPSQKIQVLKKAASKNPLTPREFKAVFQGLYLCTNCDRCTVVCPSGINLKSLWLSSRENFIQKDPEDPYLLSGFSFVRGLTSVNLEKETYEKPLAKIFETLTPVKKKTGPLTIDAQKEGPAGFIDLPHTETFSHCFGCQNCSTICPVVTSFEKPEDELTLLPHQIMYSLGLGLVDMAKGSAMIWNCLSCYQCQENCPQNVSVCDILFQLKNKAFLKDLDS